MLLRRKRLLLTNSNSCVLLCVCLLRPSPCSDGTAKVGDVGMAKIMAGDYVSGVVGTLAWSAPELLLGQRCTAKADIYSFGVVLWEIATGDMPVRGQLRDPM